MSPDDGLWFALPFLGVAVVLLLAWLAGFAGIIETDNTEETDHVL